jgi:hypothetical protein
MEHVFQFFVDKKIIDKKKNDCVYAFDGLMLDKIKFVRTKNSQDPIFYWSYLSLLEKKQGFY